MSNINVIEEILKCRDNIVISAGAGSGKTSILTQKILDDLQKNRTHYKVAAITFTNKAAEEIKDRLKGKFKGNFIGTNDSFVENEIIRPFIEDAFNNEYKNDFIVTYTKEKFDTYNEGLEILKNSKLLSKYKDNKKNFKFQLALDILNKSKVARQYLIARYSRIYIDEYQDSDNDMHKLFMYINELGIKLFIVGDINQCIFKWRGANPDLFKSLFDKKDKFTMFELKENFRCCTDIQNYSNLMCYKTLDNYIDNGKAENVIGIYKGNMLNYIDIDKEIAILVWKNDTAIELEANLKEEGFDFIYIPRTPLDELGTNNKNILIELARFIKDCKYSHFDLIKNLGLDLNKEEIEEFKSILSLLNRELSNNEIEQVLIKIFEFLSLEFNEGNEINAFIEAVTNIKYENSFNGKTYLHKIITVHSAKGLEFEQVIMFASDFKIYSRKHEHEHYVSVTRAKSKLIINLDDIYYKKYIDNMCSSLRLDVSNVIMID